MTFFYPYIIPFNPLGWKTYNCFISYFLWSLPTLDTMNTEMLDEFNQMNDIIEINNKINNKNKPMASIILVPEGNDSK